MEGKTQFPILKWAQRKDLLYITINVVHTDKPTVEIIDGKTLKYAGSDGVKKYAFEIEFNDEVVKEESKYTLDSRNIFLKIKKKTSGPYWPRLTKDNVKYQWIQVDWAYYTEEDEEDEVAQPNFDGQDFGDLGGEMDEDDEPPKDECGCGHDHDHAHEHAHEPQEGGDKKEEGNADKKADLSDLDKEQ